MTPGDERLSSWRRRALCPFGPAAANKQKGKKKKKDARGLLRINAGFIVTSDPITAFCFLLSHSQPKLSSGTKGGENDWSKWKFSQTNHRTPRPMRSRRFLLNPRLSAVFLPASPGLKAGGVTVAPACSDSESSRKRERSAAGYRRQIK